MNERIKELEKQSYVSADVGDGVYQKFSTEKFAELIVQECAMLVWNDKGKYNCSEQANRIREHFGVE